MVFGLSKSQAIIDSKRSRREKLVSSAPKYSEDEHAVFTYVSGVYFPALVCRFHLNGNLQF